MLDRDININLKMVKDGYAWHFKKYNSEKRFADAESDARNEKLGIWAAGIPMAPWDFRAKERSKKDKKD